MITVSIKFREARVAGALTAALVWAPFAALALLSSPLDPRGAALGFAGLIVSPAVGYVLGPAAAISSGMATRLAWLFALLAVCAGSVVWSVLFVLLDRQSLGDTFGFAAVGLIFLGLPLLLLGFVLAFVWTTTVRRIVNRLVAA